MSNADFSNLSAQILDAKLFLLQHVADLQTVQRFPGVESITLDFAIETRDVAVQSESFPADLLATLGRLGIDLTVSIYPQAEGP